VNRERASQLDERANANDLEMIQEQAIADQMEYDRQQALREMQANEVTRRQHMVQGRFELENQMAGQNYERMMEAQRVAEEDKNL